jgi:hypothetical protein
MAEHFSIGDRVLLTGDHPQAGETGTYLGVQDTQWGRYPVVRLDSDGSTVITGKGQCTHLTNGR